MWFVNAVAARRVSLSRGFVLERELRAARDASARVW
jgi:hypothetical protein